jgi:hypothetical protein
MGTVDDLHHPSNRRWALTFEAVNACSWSAILGAPLILALKSLEVSATVLGVAVALPPMTAALQMAGARWLPRFGYRGLMLRGWATRTVLAGLMGLAMLVSSRVGAGVATGCMLALLGGFVVLRGFSSCAWMPWVIQLIPENERGRYLARAGMLIQATLIGCGLAYSAVFKALPGAAGFAVVFGWGCATGFVATWVMSRIPDAGIEIEGLKGGAVPWRAMLRYPPFKAFLVFSVLANVALAALSVLWVPVLRDLYHRDDGFIALLPVIASGTQLALLPALGRLVDRAGSRPVLFTSLQVWAFHAVLWGGLAAGWLPLSWPVLAAIQVTAGVGGASFGLASTRLLMSTVPVQGRSHFFALHSVGMAVGQGVAPVLWGLALDGLGVWRGGALNGHAALYLMDALLLFMAAWAGLRLSESRALGTAEFMGELFVRTPLRALARLVNLNG